MSSAGPSSNGTRRYEVAAVGLVMLLAAIYFAYATLWSYVWQLQAYSSFVPVTAAVLESSVGSSGSSATTHGQSFSPHIVYHYNVAGTEYESDRYFFAGAGWDRSSAEATVARFSPGTLVQAYVDAGSPTRAVLDRSKPKLGALLYAGPFGLLALAAVVYGLRKRRGT
jgi:hypothetical protein